MTRTIIRHTLSALAAVTLVFAFTGSPASAQSSDNPRKYGVFMDTKHGKAKTPKGLATQKPGKNPVGLRDQEFRTNERLMTVR
jgi:hypothetical protein